MKKFIYLFIAVIFSFQCKQSVNDEIIISSFSGWWIYGEGIHIFKDEKTLEEWEILFLNESKEEIKELYLAVTELEYFPMECVMQGYVDSLILKVVDFDITYIQGCEEQLTN